MNGRNELSKADTHFKNCRFRQAEELYRQLIQTRKLSEQQEAFAQRSIACCIINRISNNPKTEDAIKEATERLDEAQAKLLAVQAGEFHKDNIDDDIHALLQKRATVTWNYSLNLFDDVEEENDLPKRTKILQTALEYIELSTSYYRQLSEKFGAKYPKNIVEYHKALNELGFTHEVSFADYYLASTKQAGNATDLNTLNLKALHHYLRALNCKFYINVPTATLREKIMHCLLHLSIFEPQLPLIKQELMQCTHSQQALIYADLFTQTTSPVAKRFAAENLCAHILFLKRYALMSTVQQKQFTSSPIYQQYKEASQFIETETAKELAQKRVLEGLNEKQSAKKIRIKLGDAILTGSLQHHSANQMTPVITAGTTRNGI